MRYIFLLHLQRTNLKFSKKLDPQAMELSLYKQ